MSGSHISPPVKEFSIVRSSTNRNIRWTADSMARLAISKGDEMQSGGDVDTAVNGFGGQRS